MIRRCLFLLIFLLGSPLAQASALGAEKATRLNIVVSIEPLAAFVEGVAKDTANITVMVPPGADPHTYEPTPNQLVEMSKADVYVKLGSGIDFERVWIEKIHALNRKMLVCDSSKGVTLIEMKGQDHGTHAHGEGNPDPHIWLSPSNAIIMARNIMKTLSQAEPDNADFYTVNTRDYIVELKELDKAIRATLSGLAGRKFVVFHPAWGYFAAAYGLEEVAIEAGGKEPAAKELVEMVKETKEAGARAIFVSPQHSTKNPEVVAKEIGARIVVADPLSRDYITNLRKVAEELSRSFK